MQLLPVKRGLFFFGAALPAAATQADCCFVFSFASPRLFTLRVWKKKAVAWAAEKNIAASIGPGQWGIVSA